MLSFLLSESSTKPSSLISTPKNDETATNTVAGVAEAPDTAISLILLNITFDDLDIVEHKNHLIKTGYRLRMKHPGQQMWGG